MPSLIGIGVYCVAIVGAQALLNDGDTLSHIAIGRWIIAHRAIPFDDPFSYTVHGQNWVPHEWLAEIALASLYDWLGWGGVVAATGLAAAAAFAFLTLALQRTLGPRPAAIAALAAFSLTEAHFLARPHALAWPLLVIWSAGIIAARDKRPAAVPRAAADYAPLGQHPRGFCDRAWVRRVDCRRGHTACERGDPILYDPGMGHVSGPRWAQRAVFAEWHRRPAVAVPPDPDEFCNQFDFRMAAR
jgi:hypothetical protein